ncbi:MULTISPECIES: pyridoxamine 5'-phosphate oxidase family protein [unclassified Mycobacterium]|uniref:pyridoxamine 5'-phosphate oxidase family protein n=1 Tax=unclassified Mycobacterium TaxID=2642494 RepID=UPI0007FE4FFC|nr:MULTISPECIES: pyridoxamine 5'-phosphate oxidase family protein [unclassified Mycobacterium]OBB37315.1 pyridoxamine 5'-phosphate oxidase [Mycobacterium sp. 852002-51961_SCH5331710]OBH01821.1 pyridoxamine 5'-phosphate oxidase [Mycobacterium sp. E136]
MPRGQSLEELNRRRCLDLLQRVRVGRLVFTDEGVPAVHPVNFRLWRDDVVVRVAEGPKLIAATSNQLVAFEADELDPDLRTGWSVVVVGRAEELTDVQDLVEVSGTFVQPWVEGRRDHFVRIRSEKITGRQFQERGVPRYHAVSQDGVPK